MEGSQEGLEVPLRALVYGQGWIRGLGGIFQPEELRDPVKIRFLFLRCLAAVGAFQGTLNFLCSTAIPEELSHDGGHRLDPRSLL